ncbi:MAG: glycosyltransferase, partial [Methylomonas sp.]|nr:glycosyltransferase [Methylomonas sp.]
QQPETRAEMVRRSQVRLEREYAPKRLRAQVKSMIDIAREQTTKPRQAPQVDTKPHQQRVLFVSNAYVPTLQLSFIKPLAPLVAAGEIKTEFLTEEQIKRKQWSNDGYSSVKPWIINRFERFHPDLLVFCRYSGPYADVLLDLARKNGNPVIYHIDDDLLGIPQDIGEHKHRFHNEEKRLDTVRLLLNQSNLVYASTQNLKHYLATQKIQAPIVTGSIYCSGQAINMPAYRPVRKIGYMASADHAHNLTQVIGALVRLLRKHPDINFEFFGSIPSPPAFAEFGGRICHAPKIDNYEEFLQRFAEYQWDIGICPLSPIHFNLMKANTKWVEYTSVGAAVVASKDTVYDECCADGCGLLATSEDEWFEALDSLITDPKARYRQVIRAQNKLRDQYSIDRLRDQVLNVFTQAHLLVGKSS